GNGGIPAVEGDRLDPIYIDCGNDQTRFCVIWAKFMEEPFERAFEHSGIIEFGERSPGDWWHEGPQRDAWSKNSTTPEQEASPDRIPGSQFTERRKEAD